MDWQNSDEVLGADGPLARRLPDFTARASQQEMAARIAQALDDFGLFIAESGTGTGKTFAYLIPAILSGKKVVISTGTKHLQEQLFHRDLPLIREALGIPVVTALLKGRANYLCLHRLSRAEIDSRGRRRSELSRIRDWAARTRTGDMAEVSDVPEDSDVWSLVTSTADNCLGSGCTDFERCYVNRARREALASDILVVNHHLFFADLALREEGFAQLLPGVEAVIFDEAHQLPDIAAQFFGMAFSSHQVHDLTRDTLTAEGREQSLVAGLAAAVQALDKAAADFRLALGVDARRGPWYVALQEGAVAAALDALKQGLAELSARLGDAAAKGQGLAQCARRAESLLDRLYIVSERAPSGHVAWFETGLRSFVLHLTPMDVAGPFRERVEEHRKAWIFTSATLAIGQSFGHFQGQLGLEDADTALWPSPFDFARQTLMYFPPGLPDPGAPSYTAQVVEMALPVLHASRGRAFLLFTSHRALRQAATLLAGRLDFPLLIQGSAPRSELLARFRTAGNAVLLGTGSFWEGVDVRGEALSCVIIDKLPFASPDDPVLQARGRALEEAGRNAFMEHQLPAAVIALKQGVGRLIRGPEDRGVLVLCDPRLRTKGYGRLFLASLPKMPRTDAIEDVERFFAAVDASPNEEPCVSMGFDESGDGR
jgi:ATP-dependent DNA helicase DinG